MRFLLKIAFFLGLIALFLPGRPEQEGEASPGLSPVVLFYGAQQAISDLGGFCDRSPAACAIGHEVAAFVGERIGDGVALGYGLLQERLPGQPAPAVVPPEPPPAPRAYTPPAVAVPRPSRPPPPAGSGITTGAINRTEPARPLVVAPAPLPQAFAPRSPAGSDFGSSPDIPPAGGLGHLKSGASSATAALAPRRPPPAPYRQPVPGKEEPSTKALTETAARRENSRTSAPDKPFRMPGVGGSDGPARPLPGSVVPPERTPLPRTAPRA